MAVKRILLVGTGLLLQIALSAAIYFFFIDHFLLIEIIFELIGILLVLMLIRNTRSYAYMLPVIIMLALFPLAGAVFYLVIEKNRTGSKILKELQKSEQNNQHYLVQDKEVYDRIKDQSAIRYITDYAAYPISDNDKITYYPLGELAFEAMVQELKRAEKFIFFEYFIVAPGKMWDTILDILIEKAQSGVNVRVIYDDMGCITTLPKNYPEQLKAKGIKCIAFNRLNPIAGIIMNNRDHRKILVIDGKVAFSGGINISDEYININSKLGHWKDNGIRVIGDAVFNYTVMFLTMWNALEPTDQDFDAFKYDFKDLPKNQGYAAAYGESPLDEEITGEDIYLNIINRANQYVYIFTPYLIIDAEMQSALILAAKRGVDVRIVLPGIPDHKIVFTLSESYVEPLVKGGVKVYRYTPGFIHAKVFVSDDHIATVGTINLDYRSLYLHYECGLYLQDHPVIEDVKKDVLETLAVSEDISESQAKTGFMKSLLQSLLRLAAPLM